MTGLKPQLEEFESELDLLLAGDENKLIVEEVRIVLKETEGCLEQTNILLAQRQLLNKFPEHFTFALDEEKRLLQIGYARFELFYEKLTKSPVSVRQEGLLSEFVNAMQALQQHLASEHAEEWRVWIDKLRSDFAISAAELEGARSNPRNQEWVDRFEKRHDEFNELVMRIAATSDDVEKIVNLAAKIGTILKKIDFSSLPPKIVNFYRVLREEGQFPLSRFDTEIAEWLKTNGEDRLFSLRKRGLDRFDYQ